MCTDYIRYKQYNIINFHNAFEKREFMAEVQCEELGFILKGISHTLNHLVFLTFYSYLQIL